MKTIELLCINPDTKNFHKVCDRYPENKCCMCPTPSIAINIKDIKEITHLLQKDGCNGKKKALTILRQYL